MNNLPVPVNGSDDDNLLAPELTDAEFEALLDQIAALTGQVNDINDALQFDLYEKINEAVDAFGFSTDAVRTLATTIIAIALGVGPWSRTEIGDDGFDKLLARLALLADSFEPGAGAVLDPHFGFRDPVTMVANHPGYDASTAVPCPIGLGGTFDDYKASRS